MLSDFDSLTDLHVPLLESVGSYHSLLRLGALTTLDEPKLERVGAGLGAAGARATPRYLSERCE